jgi:type III pantothenate kinase
MAERDFTLAVDIGNTRIKFGVFECPDSASLQRALPTSAGFLALPVHEEIDWRVITAHFAKWTPRIRRALVAEVHPAGLQRILADWKESNWPEPTIIKRAADLPLRVNVDNPDHVGIDRLLDAVSANLLRRERQSAVIVDSGTATTINAVSSQGVFEGGAILPGLELQARSLHQHTALLPLIDVRSLADHSVAALGRNTRAALSSGLWHGQIGAIRELTAQFADPNEESPLMLVTGGMGLPLANALGDPFRFEADLALRGLAYVAHLQAGYKRGSQEFSE